MRDQTKTVYCRDGRRERQCFKDNGLGFVCCLFFGHAGRCKFAHAAYITADKRRAAEAAKEPVGYFRLWANTRGN